VDEEPLEDALLMRDEQVMHHAVAEVRGEDLARLGAGRDEADGAPRPSQVPPSSVADPPQAPPWHASFFVQRLPSSQSVPSASPAGHATCVPSQIPSSHAFSGAVRRGRAAHPGRGIAGVRTSEDDAAPPAGRGG
jgi:hypothetical protein